MTSVPLSPYVPDTRQRRPVTGRRPTTGQPAQFEAAKVVVSELGFQLPARLSFEKWLIIGQRLSSIASSSAWCLGDWLIYGEAAFKGRYREAVERTSLDYQTLRNYAWVARRFPPTRRRDGLSFAHHAEVAALPEPEQNFWLRKAADLLWSRNRLRCEVRTSLRERVEAKADDADGLPGATSEREPGTSRVTPPQEAERSISPCKIEIHVSAKQIELYETQADKAGLKLQDWVLCLLNQAIGWEAD
jgi:hypothetical protein